MACGTLDLQRVRVSGTTRIDACISARLGSLACTCAHDESGLVVALLIVLPVQLSESAHMGDDGKLYCKADFLATYASKCGACGIPIEGT